MKPYRPSNGTEGMLFEDKYCQQCVHDHAAHQERYEDGCEVLMLALAYPVDDPLYPKEWVYDETEPVWALGLCTKFEQEKECVT